MPNRFADAEVHRIAEAVAAVERRSCAELVIEIRARSGSYAHADARFAALATAVSLVLLVYMPFVVAPVFVLVDAIAVYAAAYAIAQRSPAIRRWLTAREERNERVRTHAAAAFYERGVANTSSETGLLLYASLLERRMQVLADRGLTRRLAPHEWNATVAALHAEQDVDANATVDAIRQLERLLARDAPASANDADELPNVPEVLLA